MTGLLLIIIICLLAMLVCMKTGIEYVVQDLVIRNRISMSEAEEMISVLMGDNIEARKKYITANTNFNKVDKFETKGKKKGR